MGVIKGVLVDIYYDTPSGNIILVFEREFQRIPDEPFTLKNEIKMNIEDVEKLFRATNDFLNWYHGGKTE
jgi:hypothetical protein